MRGYGRGKGVRKWEKWVWKYSLLLIQIIDCKDIFASYINILLLSSWLICNLDCIITLSLQSPGNPVLILFLLKSTAAKSTAIIFVTLGRILHMDKILLPFQSQELSFPTFPQWPFSNKIHSPKFTPECSPLFLSNPQNLTLCPHSLLDHLYTKNSLGFFLFQFPFTPSSSPPSPPIPIIYFL